MPSPRETIIKYGLCALKKEAPCWELWHGTKDAAETQILQSNGCNPSIDPFNAGNASSFGITCTESLCANARYLACIYWDDGLKPLITEKAWYWVDKKCPGEPMERYRGALVIDGSHSQKIMWQIILVDSIDRSAY